MADPAKQSDAERRYIEEYKAWQREDAERLNELCRVMREMGMTIPVNAGVPPELDPDGSLKQANQQGDQ